MVNKTILYTTTKTQNKQKTLFKLVVLLLCVCVCANIESDRLVHQKLEDCCFLSFVCFVVQFSTTSGNNMASTGGPSSGTNNKNHLQDHKRNQKSESSSHIDIVNQQHHER